MITILISAALGALVTFMVLKTHSGKKMQQKAWNKLIEKINKCTTQDEWGRLYKECINFNLKYPDSTIQTFIDLMIDKQKELFR